MGNKFYRIILFDRLSKVREISNKDVGDLGNHLKLEVGNVKKGEAGEEATGGGHLDDGGEGLRSWMSTRLYIDWRTPAEKSHSSMRRGLGERQEREEGTQDSGKWTKKETNSAETR